MSASEPPAGASAGSTLPRSIDSFLETKLHWPRVRDGWVERQRLVDLFDQATRRPVALIAAPAGYGKTTLTAQWLANGRGSRAAAWVSLDAADNDPQRLWSHVGTALDRAGCALAADVAGYMAGNSGDLVAGILPRLVHAMAAVDDIVLILDDFQVLQSAACREQVEFLIEHLPESAHLVIVSRADPGLRLGRLRASGLLAEIRADQLSFTSEEATQVLLAERVQISAPSVEQLMGRTEGWPAGVYLAGLSLTGREDADELVRQSSGNDRFVTAYFLEEVLSQGTERTRDFILTMSILDRFCAPLCDAMAGTTGSAEILDDLERRNLFVVPLDDERRWFRFHHLFGLAARSEVESLHPERLAELHRRAATWYRDHGYVAEALTHLRAAGLRAETAELIAANWLQFVDAGRAPTVLSWLQSLGRNPDGVDPVEEVAAAWMAAIFGDEPGLDRHAQLLEPFADHGPLPDGSRSVESALALIGGLFGYGGPLAMRAAAHRAVELETDGLSPFYCIAQFGVGHAAFVLGELNLATYHLDRAARSEAGPDIVRVQALAVQSLAEGELGRLDQSRELAERAMGLVDDRSLHVMPHASMAFAAMGQVQASFGKVSDALVTLEHGLALRRRYPVGPWGWIQLLMVMARVAVEASEIAMAQELLGDVSARMSRFPDGMAAMRARQAAIQADLRELIATGAREEELTSREREVLVLLQGSLTVREIADALHVSTNTVKTHIQALYRKLGVHSRTDAVAVARRDRLL